MYLLQLVQALKYENFDEIKKNLPKHMAKEDGDRERLHLFIYLFFTISLGWFLNACFMLI